MNEEMKYFAEEFEEFLRKGHKHVSGESRYGARPEF